MTTSILTLIRTAQPDGHSCFTPGDFCYRWSSETTPDTTPQAQFWRDDEEEIVGFSWLSDDYLHIITSSETAALRSAILDWGAAHLPKSGGNQTLHVPIARHSFGWETLLLQRGYRPAEPELVQRSQQPDAGTATPHLSSRYKLSFITERAVLHGWAAAYRSAFAPEMMSVETCLNVRGNPLYRPDLDLIVADSAGEIVAFALAWFDPASNTGTFEPLGCVPAHQRQGLSRALMLEGLRRLQALGASDVFVTTTRKRLPANRLYASLGFQETATSRTWVKTG